MQFYVLNFLPVMASYYWFLLFFPLSWQKYYFLSWQKPNPTTAVLAYIIGSCSHDVYKQVKTSLQMSCLCILSNYMSCVVAKTAADSNVTESSQNVKPTIGVLGFLIFIHLVHTCFFDATVVTGHQHSLLRRAMC